MFNCAAWLTAAALTFSQTPVDGVVVCPPEWQADIAPWINYRQTQGYSLAVLAPQATAVDTRAEILKWNQASQGRLKYIVLMGDAPFGGEAAAGENANLQVPTFYLNSPVIAKFGSEPQMASDNPYADIDGDAIPELCVGRICADTSPQLVQQLSRVMALEQSSDFSAWRRQVHVIAGVGGFGLIADTAIEMMARKLLTDGIPESYRLSTTQASLTSPYCPDPFRFSKTVIGRLNEGGLFWVYIGHGHVKTLDYIQVDEKYVGILNDKNVPEIKIPKGPPVAVFLACYTGAFDASQDCLAEQILASPEGPVAAIASTRVTMPYALSVLGGGMLDAVFKKHLPTLGEILLDAKQSSMKDFAEDDPLSRRQLLETLASAFSPEGHSLESERQEHLHLVHLLGDPMLKIAYPKEVSISLPSRATVGDRIKVTGVSPIAGELKLEFCYRRDRLPEGSGGRATFFDDIESLQGMQANYVKANSPEIVVEQRQVLAGPFDWEITIPPASSGQYVLRALVNGESGWASGSAKIQIRRAK